jgi:outer membrane protein assembly factor BamE
MKSQGSEPLSRRMTVFFNGDLLERHEGDEMLTEAEFAARVGVVSRSRAATPKLEASEEELKSGGSTPKSAVAATAPAQPQTTTYPPLEPVTR